MEHVWNAHWVGTFNTLRPMRRHEWWREWYRRERYLRLMTPLELNRRFLDLMRNFVILQPDTRLGFLPVPPTGIDWLELLTHTLEEFRLTYGPYPAGFIGDVHRGQFDDFSGPLSKKAASALAARGLKSSEVFLRFGNAKWMTALFEEGLLQVKPASEYKKPDHNGAVRDDELALDVSLYLTRDTIRQLVSNPQDLPPDLEGKRMDFRFAWQRDFWLYCVSSSIEPRLFVDFNAEACVIIRERAEFIRRLEIAAAAVLPGTRYRHGDAVYIDPLRPKSARIDIPMSKHFKYAYQVEHRFVWEHARASAIAPIDLKLGSLHDIAELVVL